MQTGIATSQPASRISHAGQARGGQRQCADDRQRHHRAHHGDFAVGEIDELENAVHHGVAQRDQRIDAAQHQAIDELLEKNIQDKLPECRGFP